MDDAGNPGSAQRSFEVDPVASSSAITIPAMDAVLNTDVDSVTSGFQIAVAVNITDVSAIKPVSIKVSAIKLDTGGNPVVPEFVKKICEDTNVISPLYNCEGTVSAGFWALKATVVDSHNNSEDSALTKISVISAIPSVEIIKSLNCSSDCQLPVSDGWFKLKEGADVSGKFKTNLTIVSDSEGSTATLTINGSLVKTCTIAGGICEAADIELNTAETANLIVANVTGAQVGEFTASNVKVDNTLPVANISHSSLYTGAWRVISSKYSKGLIHGANDK